MKTFIKGLIKLVSDLLKVEDIQFSNLVLNKLLDDWILNVVLDTLQNPR